ncbi:MAG: hypothetical protein AAGA55_07180 [Planctomycetota bacterium]
MLFVLLLMLFLFGLLAVAAMIVLPRFARLDPIALIGDSLTGYGANSDRHQNAAQLPTPWDPMGDANRAIEAIPFEDRSYPLIAEAAAMLDAAGARDRLGPMPGEEGWEETADWVRSDQAQAIIAVLVEAVGKPAAGFPLSDVEGPIWDAARERHGLQPIGGTPTPQPPMLDVVLPAVGQSRLAVRLLIADARIGLQDRDLERFVTGIETVYGMTLHGYGPNWLIQQLVHAATIAYAGGVLQDVLTEHPGLLTEEAAARIDRVLSAVASNGTLDLDSSGKAMFMEDQIRRFVDDRGVYNVSGAVNAVNALNNAAGGPGPSSVVTEAINADLLASFRESQRWARAARDATRAPYEPMTGFATAIEAWENEPDSIPGRIGRLIFGITMPSWPSAVGVNRLSEQRFTALRVALAAHRHRLRHGDPPQGLADIDDDLVYFDPVDGFTGGPMQFRWRDGAPFVYTYGPDKDDDGGRHTFDEDGEPWRSISDELLEAAPDGDWVLFPGADDG